MKKLLAILVVLCMVLSVCPCVSFAANTTVGAVRTAYFNSASEWAAAQSGEGEGVSVLVAYNGSDNWQAAQSFTDTDGTVTNQTVTSGTPFNTSRNALVSFEIPEGFDAEKTGMVTLTLSLKYFKQVAAGVRLAVYGNSIDGTWSVSGSNKTKFGANGTDSGLSALPLLGLTSPITTGVAGEKLTLSSFALTDYVKQMAQEGKSEVTFRLAIPYGGAWIYNAESDFPPTLKIEEGVVTTLNVNTVFYDGEEEVSSESEIMKNVVSGSEYTYDKTPVATVVKGEDIFVYSKEKSQLSVTVAEDGTSEIVIVYEKYTDANSFSGYEIEDEGAWCWFADPRAVVLKNEEGTIDVTVIGYIDVHGNIKATQINNLTNKVDEVLIRTNIQPDDHNNPTFIMVPDGRIITFYSRHTDEACFWYRVSEKPGDITTFGEEKCLETANNTTYPSPFWLSDDPEHIYLCWRGIEWHPTIAKLSLPDEDGNMEFTYGPYQMVRSSVGSNVRPYAKYASNGKDKIYMSYTATHPDNYNPNWLFFNYVDIDTMTLQNVKGTTMKTISEGPLAISHSSSLTNIVDNTGNVRNWLWQVAVAEDGYPVIANVRIDSSKNNHTYYYVKWNGSEWVKTFLTDAGGKFHPSNTEYCYSGGMTIDTDNPNVFYVSKPVAGVFGNIFEIVKYTMSADGTSVLSSEQITENSLKNNVRPWIIPGSEGDDLRLMWMNGDYDFWMVNSVYPNGYPTRIMGEVELPKENVDLSDAVVAEDYDSIGGAFVSTTETGNIVTDTSLDGSFTVSANVYLDGAYEGDIFDMGNMKLSVKNMPTKYGDDSEPLDNRPRVVLTLYPDTDFETEYVTSNVYGTSDEWQNHNIRTGGEYFFTKYDRFVNITVTREDGYLTIYRDGLVEFKDGFRYPGPEKVWVGGFDGLVEDVYVYSRALNHDEIKALCIDYPVQYPEVSGTDAVTLNYVTAEGALIKESETVTLNPGTDDYNFKPEETIIVDGVVYKFSEIKYDFGNMNHTAVYEKYTTKGENLVPDGSFEDENGNFSWGTWQTPRTDGGYNNEYYKTKCNDWFYKVNRDTNAAVLYPANLVADDYALGTRWNDGTTGLCSMANFIPVEKGKTYYVAYDYKHTTQGTDASYISTAFVSEKDFALNASGNNIPASVTTAWQTNEFAITAEEDGYIYFHFSYLGSSNNAGNGPYWYFDNFEVYVVEKEAIKAEIVSTTSTETVVKLTNVSASDVEDIKVYVASYSTNDEVIKIEAKKVTVKANDDEPLTFNVGGDVKVFIWNENMEPLCDMPEN
ncbi:MAG: BNR-4 repeat-containing protein [Clostridia bacterium]|nr:BNR-4 repeat-containing protein [Clostridia bacterium]